MKSKKILTLSMLGLLIFPVTAPILHTNSVLADTTTNTNTTIYELPKESDYNYLREERSIWTKIAKAALRTAIKNRSAVVNAVRSISGKSVANQVDRHYGTIVNALKPLLEWSEIPAQAVYDSVYRALLNSGVSRSTASQIALAIKEAVSWVL